MRIVAPPRLVLHVRRIDRDPALALLRRLIDLVKGHELRQLPTGQHLGDRRRQGRLPMIDMPDRPHIDMWLLPLKPRLRHVLRSFR